MNKAVYKPLLLVVSVLCLNAVTRFGFTDYSWGNDQFHTRRWYVLNHPDGFNTFFFGSSLTKDHIVPPLFDSLVQGGVRSFNMGAIYLTNPESYYLASRFIEQDAVKARYAFMELHEMVSFYNSWYTMVRFHYWMDGENYLFAMRALLANGWESNTLKEAKKFTLHHLEYALNIDMTYNYMVKQMEKGKGTRDVGKFGYSPLDYMKDKDHREYDEKILSLVEDWKATYTKGPEHTLPNEPELAMALELIDRFSAHGTHLVFILNPRQNVGHLPDKLAIFHALPPEHRIDMADPEKFPELFTIENSANLNHFDPSGARIFTALLAASFKELVEEYALDTIDKADPKQEGYW